MLLKKRKYNEMDNDNIYYINNDENVLKKRKLNDEIKNKTKEKFDINSDFGNKLIKEAYDIFYEINKNTHKKGMEQHNCLVNQVCAQLKFDIYVYYKYIDFFEIDKDQYHLCIYDIKNNIFLCKNHKICMTYDLLGYEKQEINYVYICSMTGKIHVCGDNCRNAIANETTDYSYVCQLTGMIIQRYGTVFINSTNIVDKNTNRYKQISNKDYKGFHNDNILFDNKTKINLDNRKAQKRRYNTSDILTGDQIKWKMEYPDFDHWLDMLLEMKELEQVNEQLDTLINKKTEYIKYYGKKDLYNRLSCTYIFLLLFDGYKRKIELKNKITYQKMKEEVKSIMRRKEKTNQNTSFIDYMNVYFQTRNKKYIQIIPDFNKNEIKEIITSYSKKIIYLWYTISVEFKKLKANMNLYFSFLHFIHGCLNFLMNGYNFFSHVNEKNYNVIPPDNKIKLFLPKKDDEDVHISYRFISIIDHNLKHVIKKLIEKQIFSCKRFDIDNLNLNNCKEILFIPDISNNPRIIKKFF